MCRTDAIAYQADEVTALGRVLAKREIRPVYQPIFSLFDGGVFGYEALSRIDPPVDGLSIEGLFYVAECEHRLWELEKLCRSRGLQGARAMPAACKLFLNVDANVIQDPDLRSGFTRENLRANGLALTDVVFEITERSAIEDMEVFTETVNHYQGQGFSVAIDDFGSGYSGMNRVCSLQPDYLKIDLTLVRNVNSEALKRSAVTSIVCFCREANIRTIAEGIETLEELATLIELGVDYGQGYLLGRPKGKFSASVPCAPIIDVRGRLKSRAVVPGHGFDSIAMLARPGTVLGVDENALVPFQLMRQSPDVGEVVVLDEDRRVQGILPRSYVLEMFSGRFGYEIGRKHTTGEVMQRDFLSVEGSLPLDEVVKRAMARGPERVYNAVVVTQGGTYAGLVTVKDLLLSSTSLQVRRARFASPLTGLPGNWEVQEVIDCALRSGNAFSLAYFDLDNFKAYNDAYGFSHGDRMIQALSDALCACAGADDFVGHIGGDDFVMVGNGYVLEQACRAVIERFAMAVRDLYTSQDLERGFIVSKNRAGFVEEFPLATLSVAVVTNRNQGFSGLDALSEAIAGAKKAAKQASGNSLIVL